MAETSELVTFLIGVGAVCGVTTLLAVGMIIAEATIANYGTCKIKINDDRELEVEGGRSLLATLMDEGIFIPSACGGKGACGLCKIRVLSGATDYLPTETPWLSDEEMKNQVRLSCQIKVKKDLSIVVPEELFNIKEYKTEVAKIRDLTHDIKEVTLKLIEPGEINFKPGQFIQFEVPEYELTAEPVYRAYSVASAPSRTKEIELEIRLVPNGICTTYVHQFLKEGEKVTINGPYGDFFLRDTDAEIVFIAGGSGMAPVKSILYDMREKGNARKTRYFFGARAKRDLFLTDEMRQLEKDLPDFQYIPALSEPHPEDNWEGETGLITEVLDRHLKSGENVEGYLCGSPGMIAACVKVLTENGVPEEKIYYDSFG